MGQKKYKRLSYKERVIIQTLLEQKKTISLIANQLNREKSTISREVKKWVKLPVDKYLADLAHWAAKDDYLTKRGLSKIVKNAALRTYVFRGLLQEWSPEQIEGRIKKDYPNNKMMRISYESIYGFIYRNRQAKLNRKLIALLPYSKPIRRPYKGSANRKRIKDAVSIDERPLRIEKRKEAGHWEGDLIIGAKQSGAIGTLVERKTRFTHIIKLKNKKSSTVTNSFRNRLNKMGAIFRKTLTYDNGIEMSKHKWFTQKTGMKVYFAHPYSAWERGTNENTNGLIRRYFPKKTDLNMITEEELQFVEDRLNNRPRKVLGFRTPMEEKNRIMNIVMKC